MRVEVLTAVGQTDPLTEFDLKDRFSCSGQVRRVVID
jgi:hypothetical protein